MKSQNTKSSDQLKKEVDKEIRNVKRDLDVIEGRLSPGQIIDDAIFYPHGKNLRSTLDHLKRNPIGTAFLSLGTLLLMEDENHVTYEASTRTRFNDARSSVNSKVSSVTTSIKDHLPSKAQISGAASRSGDNLRSKVDNIKHSVQGKVEQVKGKVQSKVEDTKSSFTSESDSSFSTPTSGQFGSDAGAYDGGVSAGSSFTAETGRGQKIKDKASEVFSSGKDLYASGKDKFQNLDPMAYMALGAGLGAITGASLPVSQKEQSFVDDKLSEKFSNIGQELQDAINESSNILKDLVIGDVKDMSFKVFR